MNDNGYINIQGWMITRLGLKGNELILFALIYGFSQDGQSDFHGSITYIQKALQISRPSVVSLLKKLREKGYIQKTKESHYRAVVKKLNYPLEKVVKKLNHTSKVSLLPTSKETLLNNNNNNNNNNNEQSSEFSFDEEVKKLEDNPRRDLNIIAYYMRKRRNSLLRKIKNYQQFKIFLRRHLRPAKDLKVYTDEQIVSAVKEIERKYSGIDWTLETLLKELTK